MNVLFILSHLPNRPDIDGTSRWFYNTIKPMSQIVNRVDVAGQFTGNLDKLKWINDCCHSIYSVAPVDYSKFRYKWLLGWDYGKIHAYNPDLVKLINKICNKNNYDLVILVGHGTHVYLQYIKAKHIMAAPLDAPDIAKISPNNHFSSNLKIFLNKIAIKQSEKTYSKADSVLVVSEKDKQILMKAGLGNIFVCPIGVDTEEFSPMKTKNKKRTILFTGVLDFPPNVDAAIHLVNDIYKPSDLYKKGITCQIAGRNPLSSVSELRKIDGVEILIDLPDLRPIINDATVYIVPMRIGLGMKNKVLEAMSIGKPIVGYPLAFNGLENPQGFAFVCETPLEIIETINKLIDNLVLVDSSGKKSRDFVINHYSARQYVNKILEMV